MCHLIKMNGNSGLMQEDLWSKGYFCEWELVWLNININMI